MTLDNTAYNQQPSQPVQIGPSDNLKMGKVGGSKFMRSSIQRPTEHISLRDGSVPLDPQPQPAPDGQSPEAPVTSTNTDDTNWEKRYADARRYINDLTDRIKVLEQTPKEEQIKLPKTAEELESWKKSQPETYDAMLSMIRMENASLMDELQTLRAETQNQRIFKEVLKAHPDAAEIRESQKFVDWFNVQSNGVKALIESYDAIDIIKGIKLFKDETGVATKTSTVEHKSADSAALVDTRSSVSIPTGGKIWTSAEIRNMPIGEYAKHKAEILQAYREGRVK